MSQLHPIPVSELHQNVFTAIGKEWMLITAETEKDGKPTANTMTASWGGLGRLWNKDVAFAFIRPQRYTKEFVDSADSFSLCFFGGEKMQELGYLGTVSGRDEDKIAKSGLTLTHIDGVPCFEEATIDFCSARTPSLIIYRPDGAVETPELKGEYEAESDVAGINISNLGPYYTEIKYFLECVRDNKPVEVAPLIEGVKSVELAIKELEAAKAYVAKHTH